MSTQPCRARGLAELPLTCGHSPAPCAQPGLQAALLFKVPGAQNNMHLLRCYESRPAATDKPALPHCTLVEMALAHSLQRSAGRVPGAS